jgi:hypothetical protein
MADLEALDKGQFLGREGRRARRQAQRTLIAAHATMPRAVGRCEKSCVIFPHVSLPRHYL